MAQDKRPYEVADILHQAAEDAVKAKLEELGRDWRVGLTIDVSNRTLHSHVIESVL